jgi:hypothetical protein
MDVNYEEIVSTMEGKKDKVSAGVSYMLHKGFIFTKIVDNWAIAFGGATMYRNRINTYLKQGVKKDKVEKEAFLDFQEVSEPTQQSSRPDLVSQEQASPWGRFLLTFQNVTMQNNRNGKRAVLDFVNRRGDMKTNLSKIVYYFGVQNMIFLGMQQALFAAYWDDDATDEDRTKKHLKMGNGLLDVYLRGGGMYGVGIATIKNTILKYMEESKKGLTILSLLYLRSTIAACSFSSFILYSCNVLPVSTISSITTKSSPYLLAVMLSHKLNIPFYPLYFRTARLEGDDFVVIDDIVDTGKTLQEYKIKDENEQGYYVTIHEHKDSIVKPDYSVIYKEDKWIVYPWETTDSDEIQDYLK